jgi:protein ImuA
MWKEHQPDAAQSLLPTGAPYVDERLRGGITQAGLHEFFGGAKADSHAAAAFALLLAGRLPESDAGIFWISGDKERQTSGRLYPYGLSAMGGNPARMLLVQTADLRDALRAAVDAIRSKAASAVILETHGNARLVDLTSTRRLALAAAEQGCWPCSCAGMRCRCPARRAHAGGYVLRPLRHCREMPRAFRLLTSACCAIAVVRLLLRQE